ncbi:MAG: hypothetical protein ACYDC2_01660 [Solirubrobacteraceae bacterium]
MRAPSAMLALLCAVLLGGCGDTLQVKPVPHNVLESLIAAPEPVYWLGARFAGLQVTSASRDPGGAYTVEYGNCLEGGQGACTPPLRVVTSPDNSFLPGSTTHFRSVKVRGVDAMAVEAGRAYVIPTGAIVLSIYAQQPRVAAAAARAAVPINLPASPGEALPPRLPDSGYGSTPLPAQLPATVRPLG